MSDTALAPTTAPSSTRESLSPTSTATVPKSHVAPSAPSASIPDSHVPLLSPQLSTVSESRLLRLPLELRYMIYEYTLALSDCPAGAKGSFSQLSYDGHVHNSILLVCRQIYAEARSICFQINTLTFSAGFAFDMFLNHLASWQRDEIKSLTLRLAGLAYDERHCIVFKESRSVRFPGDSEVILDSIFQFRLLIQKKWLLRNLKHLVFELDTSWLFDREIFKFFKEMLSYPGLKVVFKCKE